MDMEQSKYPWISEYGTFAEAEMFRKCMELFDHLDNPVYLLLMTDSVCCGRDHFSDVLNDSIGRLLEIRIFDTNRELWAHRSMLGQDFSWRTADDHFLKNTVANPSDYKRVVIQKLDIDEKNTPSEAAARPGIRKLRATGGGIYELPVEKSENAVSLTEYISYDHISNSAVFSDFRINGFASLEE